MGFIFKWRGGGGVASTSLMGGSKQIMGFGGNPEYDNSGFNYVTSRQLDSKKNALNAFV